MVDSAAPWQVPPPQRPPAPQAVQSGAGLVTQLPAAQAPTEHSPSAAQAVPSTTGAATQLPAWQVCAVQGDASLSQAVPSGAGSQETQEPPALTPAPQASAAQLLGSENTTSSIQAASEPAVPPLSLL